jgi:hypothetical protein
MLGHQCFLLKISSTKLSYLNVISTDCQNKHYPLCQLSHRGMREEDSNSNNWRLNRVKRLVTNYPYRGKGRGRGFNAATTGRSKIDMPLKRRNRTSTRTTVTPRTTPTVPTSGYSEEKTERTTPEPREPVIIVTKPSWKEMWKFTSKRPQLNRRFIHRTNRPKKFSDTQPMKKPVKGRKSPTQSKMRDKTFVYKPVGF